MVLVWGVDSATKVAETTTPSAVNYATKKMQVYYSVENYP